MLKIRENWRTLFSLMSNHTETVATVTGNGYQVKTMQVTVAAKMIICWASADCDFCIARCKSFCDKEHHNSQVVHNLTGTSAYFRLRNVLNYLLAYSGAWLVLQLCSCWQMWQFHIQNVCTITFYLFVRMHKSFLKTFINTCILYIYTTYFGTDSILCTFIVCGCIPTTILINERRLI